MPGALGVTPSQAALLNASVQVHAALGRFLNITAGGLTLFRTSSHWQELGVAEYGARTDIFRHPPMKSLAPEGTMDPFQQIYNAALDLRPKYGAYYRWFDAYFVPFKAERKLAELFAALEARWMAEREKLIARLPEIRAWMQEHVRRAAAEAYDAYVATAPAPCAREQFIDRALERAEARFLTPELIEAKLRIALVDVLPPDTAKPSRRLRWSKACSASRKPSRPRLGSPGRAPTRPRPRRPQPGISRRCWACASRPSAN